MSTNPFPSKVKCLTQVEVWRPGCTLIFVSGMYKSMHGCIFGLSVNQVMDAIQKGKMKEVSVNEPTVI